jgi:NADH:ubiquinone oxidoreductase subunit E
MTPNKAFSEAINKHGVSRDSLLPVLQYVISKEQWLKEETMEEVAKAFGMSAAEVYGVATFYSFLDTEPRGRYVIRVCRTISCDMAGKKEIIESLKNELRLKQVKQHRMECSHFLKQTAWDGAIKALQCLLMMMFLQSLLRIKLLLLFRSIEKNQNSKLQEISEYGG